MNPGSPRRDESYLFGPFILDHGARTLERAGEPVVLTPKALDLLLFLIEKDGRVVSKSEIMERVWPGTFVEEGNIFQTISILRKALDPFFDGDSPIVTVPRKGYRFGVPIEKPPEHALAGIEPAPGGQKETAYVTSVAPPSRSWWPYAIASLIAMGLIFGFRNAALGKLNHRARPAVAVLPLKNLSESGAAAWMSTAVAETLSSELAAGEEIRTIPADRVQRMMKDLAIAPGVELTESLVRDMRSNLGCDFVLTGSYLELNGQLRLNFNLTDTRSNESVAVLSETDESRELLGLVTRTGAELREKMGLAPLRDARNEGVRSSISKDPDAAMAYLQGLGALRLLDRPTAKTFFEKALKIDPKFARAHAALASTLGALGRDKDAAEEAKRAFDFSPGLSREDRLNIEAQYYATLSNWAKAEATYRALWREFPDNIEYILSAGQTSFNAVRGKDVLEAVDEARKLPPPANTDPRIDILESNGAQLIGDYGRAEGAAARAVDSATKAKAPLFLAGALVKRAAIEDRKEKYPEATADLTAAQHSYEKLGDRQGAADCLRLHAGILRKQGQLDSALAENEEALQVSREIGFKRLTGRILAQIGLIQGMQGHDSDALKALQEAVAIGRATGDKGGLAGALLTLGFVLRKTGDLAGAETTYVEAGAICRELSDPLGTASTLNSSASVNISRGEYQQAGTQLAEAEQLFRKLGNRKSLAETLSNIGTVAFYTGDLAKSASAYQEECELHHTLNEKGQLVLCRINQALVMQESGQSEEAKKTIATLLNDPDHVQLPAAAWAKIVTMEIAQGRLDDARRSLEQGRAAAAKSHDPEQTIPLQIASARLDEATGNRPHAAEQLVRARADAERFGLAPLAQVAHVGMTGLIRPAVRYANAVQH